MDYAPREPRRYPLRAMLADAVICIAAGCILGALVAPFFFPQLFSL